jgi:exonuclease III
VLAVRVVSWNLNGAVDDRARRQAAWIADQEPDLLLLQEAATRMLGDVAAVVGMPTCQGADPPPNRRQRSVAVMTRLPLSGGWLHLGEGTLPHVALGTTVRVDGTDVEVWCYHAPNGATYGPLKVTHAEAMAQQLSRRGTQPTVVGSDLNTPLVDPPDARFIRTHWESPSRLRHGDPTDAVLCGAPRRRVHQLDDALRVYAADQPEVLPDIPEDQHGPLAVSYRTRRPNGQYRRWRFDIVWVSPALLVKSVRYATDETLRPGMSDHAAVVVDLQVR